ncbi:phosphofructokinase [Rubrobacter radiotolerans]|uniref:Pyrophosphate--fructose 6-phosphate 1-phosphotransferase n=1 Tax=Rubrobacter radiotolerans TaxID=42256 RepID=A0A023X490_RUBRA|nr:ATP-dependent 6-phosphofructokinase [Rubrobacter radiotolerans]AHY47148.1 phosphofructokinase [Rubrobacter radiotolerans]MDX5894554.1 ATP-dependent 6-phosphofructokinase [Rubrobacter radiotolerans]SMC06243.1 pyrophosphate-dependent phosphofructokinase [Rubrobacter radiotolerans DSM 5868]
MAEVKRVGMLTGGGDAPGLNGVIRAVTMRCISEYGYEVVGLRRGWKALTAPEEDTLMPLGVEDVRYILQEGGTVLGSSRTNPYKNEGDAEKVVEQLREFGIDALVAIGGDDTLGVARRLHDDFGVQVIGCPKTIDNDLSATDTTFGYDTAVAIATDAIDRLRTTAKSHERILVVEIMGRHAGWITYGAGLASSANVTLIPEVEPDLDEVTAIFKKRAENGERWGLVAVSEGVTFSEDFVTQTAEKDEFGHVRLGGVAEGLAAELKERTGIDTRHVVLGHLQRGGTPTANDRILSTRYGYRAAEAVANGEWGKMVALRGDEIVTVSLAEATDETKTVPKETYEMLRSFFG